MTMDRINLALLIPCYNESKRFQLLEDALVEFDQLWKVPFEVVIINDGSTDDTLQKAEDFHANNPLQHGKIKVLDVQPNSGKGYVLKKGVAESGSDWILTLDADMSAPPSELLDWLKHEGIFRSDRVYIASRVHSQSRIQARIHRVVLGNLFNLVVKIITGVQEGDTQCGFKLYPRAIADKLFPLLQTPGWAHDIEILCRCQKSGYLVQTMPIKWSHVPGGSIKLLSDGLKMIAETVRISRMVKAE